VPRERDQERRIPRPREVARDVAVLMIVRVVGSGLSAALGVLSLSLGTGLAIVVLAVRAIMLMR